MSQHQAQQLTTSRIMSSIGLLCRAVHAYYVITSPAFLPSRSSDPWELRGPIDVMHKIYASFFCTNIYIVIRPGLKITAIQRHIDKLSVHTVICYIIILDFWGSILHRMLPQYWIRGASSFVNVKINRKFVAQLLYCV